MSESSSPSRLFVITLVALSFLGAIDHTIVATTLPVLSSDLGAVEHMSWIIVGYTLASTVFVPVYGRLGDLFGARQMLITATAIFVTGSLLCGFAQDIVWMTASRVLQGVGAAGMHLLPQTIIGAVVPARRRPQLMSLVGAAFPVAMVLGPLVGGMITDAWGWPWVFWVNVPVGLIALWLVVVGVPNVAGTRSGGFDLGGAVLVGLMTIALVLASTWGAGSQGWAHPWTLTALGVALVAGVLLWPVERRASAPVLPMSVIRYPTVAIATVLSVIFGVGLFAVVAYIPTYVQLGYLVTATASGIVPMAMMFGMLVGTLLSGWVVSRNGSYRWAPLVGTAVGGSGLLAMALLPAGIGIWAPTVVMGVVGLGVGTFMQLVVVIAQAGAPRSELGTVTAVVTLSRQILSSVASALVGAWIGTEVTRGTPEQLRGLDLVHDVVVRQPVAVQEAVSRLYLDTLAPVFLILSVVFAIGFVAATRLPGDALAEQTAARDRPSGVTAPRSRLGVSER